MRQIIVRYSDTARQWSAFFDRAPIVNFGGAFSMEAVHRLLEGCDTPAGDMELRVDGRLQAATWQPPELLIRCPTCDGKCEYVGLNTRETCASCGGKGFIPV